MGGRTFGVSVFRGVADRDHEVVGVWTPPGDKLEKVAIDEGGVPRIRADDLPAFEPDLLVSAHNHAWIRQEDIDQAGRGCIGYHPSLLPRHRGKDAVRWTIHMRDPIAGGTVYWLDGDKADTGPILSQDWCHVRPDDSASSLWGRDLFQMGVRLLVDAVDRVATGTAPKVPQDEALATWEPAFDRPQLREAA